VVSSVWPASFDSCQHSEPSDFPSAWSEEADVHAVCPRARVRAPFRKSWISDCVGRASMVVGPSKEKSDLPPHFLNWGSVWNASCLRSAAIRSDDVMSPREALTSSLKTLSVSQYFSEMLRFMRVRRGRTVTGSKALEIEGPPGGTSSRSPVPRRPSRKSERRSSSRSASRGSYQRRGMTPPPA